MTVLPTRTAALLVAGVLTLAAAGTSASTAGAAASTCASRTNNSLAKLLECVDLAGVREHQAAFQAIANANGGTRVSGSPGYDQSVGLRRGAARGRRLERHPAGLPVPDVRLAARRRSSSRWLLLRPVRSPTRSCPTRAAVTSPLRSRPSRARRSTRPPAARPADFAGFVPGHHRPGLPRRVHLRDQGDQRLRRGRGRRGDLQQHGRRHQRDPGQRLHPRPPRGVRDPGDRAAARRHARAGHAGQDRRRCAASPRRRTCWPSCRARTPETS